MYPLKMIRTVEGDSSFAVASDEGEHAKLSAMGYGPSYVAPAVEAVASATGAPQTVDEARAMLDAKGIAYDGRWSLGKLIEALTP
jgi:hypothetical protein